MTNRRVVISGMGALTPIGMSTPEFWKGLVSGKSGVREITHFDTTNYATKFAAQLEDYDASRYLEQKVARRMDKFCQYAMIATDEALVDSRIDLNTINKDLVAVLIGSGIGGMDTIYQQSLVLKDRGPRSVSPFFYPNAYTRHRFRACFD